MLKKDISKTRIAAESSSLLSLDCMNEYCTLPPSYHDSRHGDNCPSAPTGHAWECRECSHEDKALYLTRFLAHLHQEMGLILHPAVPLMHFGAHGPFYGLSYMNLSWARLPESEGVQHGKGGSLPCCNFPTLKQGVGARVNLIFFFFQDLFEMKVSWYAQSVLR